MFVGVLGLAGQFTEIVSWTELAEVWPSFFNIFQAATALPEVRIWDGVDGTVAGIPAWTSSSLGIRVAENSGGEKGPLLISSPKEMVDVGDEEKRRDEEEDLDDGDETYDDEDWEKEQSLNHGLGSASQGLAGNLSDTEHSSRALETSPQ